MKLIFTLFLLSITTLSNAAGPLFVEGNTGNIPVKYQDPVITLNFDLDMLSITPTNAETDALVIDAFSLWNNVTTSSVILNQGNDMSVNVDETNYDDFIPADGSDLPINDDGLNPVIYDLDGAIIDAFFGAGQSDNIAGFAVSSFRQGSSAYEEGYSVINGKNLGLTKSQTTLIFAHEIGHFIGLDHTLADIVETAGTACTTKALDQYPLMYPFVCRLTTPLSLHQDDVISVSTLYPSADINQQLGQITGNFVLTNNDAILGANIWAQNTNTNVVYSVISDYLTGNTGFFSLYLPPGTYTLHANSLGTDFEGASSIGPYAQDLTDISFQAPHTITPVNYEGDTPGVTQTLTVTAGEATNVNFRLDGSGTSTTGNPVFISSATTAGGDSGSLAPTSLLLILLLSWLRKFQNNKRVQVLPY